MRGQTVLQAIRGATTAVANDAGEILTAVRELLSRLLAINEIGADQLVCAFFSATPDLDACFPARAARELGWSDVALFGMQELAVRGAPERCVRVMLLVQPQGVSSPDGRPAKPQHVYLRGAQSLRPDLLPQSASSDQAESPGPKHCDPCQPGAGPVAGPVVTSLFGGCFTYYYL
jgi:chorismate mutase